MFETVYEEKNGLDFITKKFTSNQEKQKGIENFWKHFFNVTKVGNIVHT